MKAEIIPINSDMKHVQEDISSTKAEILPIDPVKQETEDAKAEVIAIKTESTKIPEKNAEPLTSAATPVPQKVSPDQMMSPIEGKENIPVIKTGDVATKNSPEVIEVPYKPKLPEAVNVEPDTYKSTFIHEVKKRKLDILKRRRSRVRPPLPSPIIKDGRPTVIQQTTSPAQIISKPIKAEIMPPPPINSLPPKRTHISIPQALNISQVKVAPTTPIKPPKPSLATNPYSYVNGSTPPRVVQSKSIYSYSEKTVYGNPKDILSPTIKKCSSHT
ncbi:hypothetical protein NQ318_014711 [Aromia moschata]|uniref:Uncharacterized protein n=1 Tax=Aromia moschata TaxID=1265417 RepID=A0AAV8ZDQ0_9CUCU|nr:hypothetical protein NQ318_014711 [Aromia moschata]